MSMYVCIYVDKSQIAIKVVLVTELTRYVYASMNVTILRPIKFNNNTSLHRNFMKIFFYS